MANFAERLGACRYCGKPIAWVKTVAGKSMPVDPKPVPFVPDGGKDYFVCDNGRVVRGIADKNGSEKGHISHFATCPYADQARKGTKDARK